MYQEEDEESMDWWTKYFASIDSLIEVGRKNILMHAFITFNSFNY